MLFEESLWSAIRTRRSARGMRRARGARSLVWALVVGALASVASGCGVPLLGGWRSAPQNYTDTESGEGLAVLSLFLSGRDMGGTATGALVHSARSGGCVTTRRFAGTWARVGPSPATAAMLSVDSTSLERNSCTDAARNTTSRPLTDAERAAFVSLVATTVRTDGEVLSLGPLTLRRE